jgi:hypothetical protein
MVKGLIDESPFFLLYGRDPVLPRELKFAVPSVSDSNDSREEYKIKFLNRLKQAFSKLLIQKEKEQNRYKKYYDKTHKHVNFNIGDQVMVYTPVAKVGLSPKFTPRWKGPSIILERLDDVIYRVEEIKTNRVSAVHVQRLRRFKPLSL